MNRLFLIGNMVADPERKAKPDGTPLVAFRVAESRKYNGVERTTFFECAVWGEMLGNAVMQYTHKGDKVCVLGDVGARSYINKAGEPRATLTVNVRDVEFLGKRGEEAPQEQPKAYSRMIPTDDDDMPF